MIKRFLAPLMLAVAFSASASEPPYTLQGPRSPAAVADCLDAGLHRLKLPASFISPLRRDDSSASLGLINPLTGSVGLGIAIVAHEPGSQVTVTSNGMPLSPSWRQMIQRCMD
ncbi:hypothetical protein [Paludibacterium yongneupense]|uniref:hypothetical protein n=1 Tax=Paludibacterium yongneupense TaxID=400061 RepID=UPI0003FB66A3|nr:hypothetical protein [Paludibacterium yongneupense]